MGWYGLSDSEHEIMKYIWKHEEVTLREVVAWLENRGYTWTVSYTHLTLPTKA